MLQRTLVPTMPTSRMTILLHAALTGLAVATSIAALNWFLAFYVDPFGPALFVMGGYIVGAVDREGRW